MNEKILIVDDEPEILETLIKILTAKGFRVRSASGGETAVQIFQSEPFDLVITDIRMPGLSGLEVMGQVKALDEYMEVIVLTGFATLENAITALRDGGAFDYLSKPLEDIDELLNTVEQALTKRKLRLENKALLEERKKAEAQIRKLSTAVEQSMDGIAISDLSSNLLYVNKAFALMHGYSPQAMLGLKVAKLQRKIEPERYRDMIKQITTQGSWMGELEHLRFDGTQFPAFMSATLLNPDAGKASTILMIVRDIGDRKRLETQLQRSQRLEVLGTLAGGIAHNFNNLLMGIIGYTSIVLLNTDESHPHYKDLKNIEKLVDSGSNLTGQLLGYARKGNYKTQSLRLNRLVEEISLAFGATRKEIRIHLKLSGDLKGIIADPSQVEQVLMNLFVNAADAMPGDGDLFLETINVTQNDINGKSHKPKHGNYVLLTVRDTGIGMDDGIMEHIFDPFFTTKGLAKGTGLGLASVYGIIKSHGGYIDVHSKKGRGTTFSIYLPASDKAIPDVKTIEEKVMNGQGNILLVDDEEMVLEIGVKMLEYIGYEAIGASGGKNAMESYQTNKDRIDLVILDMIMPDLSGGMVYDRMKAINPDVKVLLSSGYNIDARAKEILGKGCNGFIQKPYNLEKLSMGIREILDN